MMVLLRKEGFAFAFWVVLSLFNRVTEAAEVLGQSAAGGQSASLPVETRGQASLGISNFSYMNRSGQLRRNQFTIGRFDAQYFRVGNEIEIQGEGRLRLGLDCGRVCNQLEFPQLYIGSSRRLGPVSLLVGRVQLPWSGLEEDWRFGIFQPRFVYDFLHPQKVGLTGGFLRVMFPQGQIHFFMSPGFIPDRGLPLNVENGRVASVDPFFHAPISEVIYEGRNTPVAYHFNRPSLSELLLRPGFGMTSQWGAAEGWNLGVSYAYKPVNQILLAYNALYNLSFEVADADLYARVLNHHVGSVDVKYTKRKSSLGLSLVREVPVQDSVPSDWTAQQLSSAWMISPQWVLRGEETFQFSASYLKIYGGNAPDQRPSGGPKVSDGNSVFEPRYPYTNAMKFLASDRLWKSGAREFNWKSQLLLDLEHSAQVYMHSFAYQFSSSWQARLATDILVGKNSGSDFISRNRANDRFFGVVNYVF